MIFIDHIQHRPHKIDTYYGVLVTFICVVIIVGFLIVDFTNKLPRHHHHHHHHMTRNEYIDHVARIHVPSPILVGLITVVLIVCMYTIWMRIQGSPGAIVGSCGTAFMCMAVLALYNTNTADSYERGSNLLLYMMCIIIAYPCIMYTTIALIFAKLRAR